MPEPTWRDETPQAVQDDLDALVAAAYERAEGVLAQHREFSPFAVAVGDDGGQATIAHEPDESGPEPDSQARLSALVDDVRRDRGRYRAVGLAAFVFTRMGDAVRLELEHRDGGPALVLLRPCRVGRWRRRVWTGPLGGSEGPRQVWDR